MSENSTIPFPSTGPVDEDRLTARVRAVSGVTDVYPPHPGIARLPSRITERPRTPTGVQVDHSGAGLQVAASIATTRHSPTPLTARQVGDALLDELPHATTATIRVQVSRIV